MASRLALYLRPDMPISVRHPFGSARRPTENLSHDRVGRPLFEQFGGSRMPKIVKTQASETGQATGAPPGRAPVGKRPLRINPAFSQAGKTLKVRLAYVRIIWVPVI
jgi:hypothetical protein